ncbi:hypothetical protein [Bacillus sp. 165]|uniref:hypothetical protein n=1 Tax=Bacillus sp. 165 TaxID=1529117 RepID=UPI001ADC3F86|nr:hypothetical protein [Bacillus sp. 165]MBO9130768.1 hypothetical protein [Bacillus sp. 165]
MSYWKDSAFAFLGVMFTVFVSSLLRRHPLEVDIIAFIPIFLFFIYSATAMFFSLYKLLSHSIRIHYGLYCVIGGVILGAFWSNIIVKIQPFGFPFWEIVIASVFFYIGSKTPSNLYTKTLAVMPFLLSFISIIYVFTLDTM